MVSSILQAAVLALALGFRVDAAQYILNSSDIYSGANFFDLFDFKTVSINYYVGSTI
jgi:hypothetical protein